MAARRLKIIRRDEEVTRCSHSISGSRVGNVTRSDTFHRARQNVIASIIRQLFRA